MDGKTLIAMWSDKSIQQKIPLSGIGIISKIELCCICIFICIHFTKTHFFGGEMQIEYRLPNG